MRVHLLLVSGSTRNGSTNTATLRTAGLLVPPGCTAELSQCLAALAAFNPDDDHDPLPPAVAQLRRELSEADAVLFCTPQYAGGLPGSFKNLLDWTVGGVKRADKRVAWINVSSAAAPGGGAGAHAGLRAALGYVGARIIEGACAALEGAFLLCPALRSTEPDHHRGAGHGGRPGTRDPGPFGCPASGVRRPAKDPDRR